MSASVANSREVIHLQLTSLLASVQGQECSGAMILDKGRNPTEPPTPLRQTRARGPSHISNHKMT